MEFSARLSAQQLAQSLDGFERMTSAAQFEGAKSCRLLTESRPVRLFGRVDLSGRQAPDKLPPGKGMQDLAAGSTLGG